LGEVILLPDHTYVIAESSSPTPRPTVEIRWLDVTTVISPDGGARILSDQEWRVVSGQLDHIEFGHSRPTRQFLWWSSQAGRIARISATPSPLRLSVHRIEWEAPVTARQSRWERICVSRELPRWYRMWCSARGGTPGRAGDESRTRESDSVGLPSHGRRIGFRLAADAHLRLMVVLPERYPIGPVCSRVRLQTEVDQFDRAEELRLARLGHDKWHQDGFRRNGTTLMLSVPRPRSDRDYEIEWTLPTVRERNRWLVAQRRRLGALIRPAPRRRSGD
jgi:hypothetical protein